MRSTAVEGAATDAWAGKGNAIVKRVDALDCTLKAEMGERFGGADQKLTDVKSEMAEMTETFSNVDQKMSVMDQKMSEIDEKMSALETKMDANVEKILGAIGLLGHSV